MRRLKNALLFSLLTISTAAFAQDDSLPTPAKRTHEFGFNTTMLIKQVFNLSNNTLTMLPYDVTYKSIGMNSAFRYGAGINFDFTSAETSSSSTGSSTTPAPNYDPTYSRFATLNFRAGWEKRWQLEKRVLVYAGVDLVGMYEQGSSQSTALFNNLPNSYSYSRTTLQSYGFAAGAGPVAGIQFFLTKRLSLFTEMPLYFTYGYHHEKAEHYINQLQFGGSFESETETETETISSVKGSFTLPVTLYLALKF